MTGSSQHRLTAETAHRVLADSRRRGLVNHLADRGTATVTELADRLADGTDPGRVAVELHHVHLPMLEATDVVERDGDRVRLTDRGREVEAVRRATAARLAGDGSE